MVYSNAVVFNCWRVNEPEIMEITKTRKCSYNERYPGRAVLVLSMSVRMHRIQVLREISLGG